MLQIRPRSVTLLAILVFLLWPASGFAQSPYTYAVGLMGGIGGSTDDDPDAGLDNFGWQAIFTMKLETSTLWGLRVGQLDLESEEDFLDGELQYFTLSGEYLFADRFYESGLYLGLGFYDFDAGPFLGDDSALGLVLGVTGDVPLTDRLSLKLEFSTHYADLDLAQFFLIGHVGVAFNF